MDTGLTLKELQSCIRAKDYHPDLKLDYLQKLVIRLPAQNTPMPQQRGMFSHPRVTTPTHVKRPYIAGQMSIR
jgi:hypothetical protein